MVVVGLRFGVSNLVSRRWQAGPTQNERKWERSLDIRIVQG